MRQDNIDQAQSFANDNNECGCPEGMCLAEAVGSGEAVMDAILDPMFDAMEDSILEDIEAEAIHNRREAVAQLGRILEVQSLAIERHARLVEEVLSDI